VPFDSEILEFVWSLGIPAATFFVVCYFFRRARAKGSNALAKFASVTSLTIAGLVAIGLTFIANIQNMYKSDTMRPLVVSMRDGLLDHLLMQPQTTYVSIAKRFDHLERFKLGYSEKNSTYKYNLTTNKDFCAELVCKIKLKQPQFISNQEWAEFFKNGLGNQLMPIVSASYLVPDPGYLTNEEEVDFASQCSSSNVNDAAKGMPAKLNEINFSSVPKNSWASLSGRFALMEDSVLSVSLELENIYEPGRAPTGLETRDIESRFQEARRHIAEQSNFDSESARNAWCVDTGGHLPSSDASPEYWARVKECQRIKLSEHVLNSFFDGMCIVSPVEEPKMLSHRALVVLDVEDEK